MKRIIALLLIGAAIFLFAPLPSVTHEKTTKELFFEQMGGLLTVPEGNLTAALQFNMPSSLLDNGTISLLFGNSLDMTINLSGGFTEENRQAALSLTAALNNQKNNKEAPLTDLIVDGGEVYLNFRSIFNFLVSMYKVPFIKYSFAADYINFKLEDISTLSLGEIPVNTNTAEVCPKFAALEGRVFMIMANSLGDEYFSNKDGVYTMSLDNAAFINCMRGVLIDIDTNTDIYADAITELQSKSPGYLNSKGLNSEQVVADRNGCINRLKDFSQKKRSELSNLTDISITAAVSLDNKNTYDLNFSIEGAKENFKVNADVKLKQDKAINVMDPEKSMSIKDVISKLGVVKSIL